MAAAADILEVKGLSKSFGKLQAVDHVSFGLAAKNITILIGPNGSGKTTLVNLISGFYKPEGGDVFYKSRRITGWAPHKVYRAGIARTFQIPALFSRLSVLENVLVAEKQNPGEGFLRAPLEKFWKAPEEASTARAAKILGLLGLSEAWEKRANALSGGQMKLLEIGRALMSGADL